MLWAMEITLHCKPLRMNLKVWYVISMLNLVLWTNTLTGKACVTALAAALRKGLIVQVLYSVHSVNNLV
ncbi:hypothetical protein D3C73_1488390 [compost metagenome]